MDLCSFVEHVEFEACLGPKINDWELPIIHQYFRFKTFDGV